MFLHRENVDFVVLAEKRPHFKNSILIVEPLRENLNPLL
jgi:hypothetical protein